MAEVGSIEYIVGADVAPLLKAEKQIRTSADNTSKAFKNTDSAVKQLNTTVAKTASSVKTATSGMDRLRGAAGNVGFQIQDMAVQLQAGTSAMVVFGQQGSQIAGAFGPGGAVIGAIIAIAAAIGSTLVGSMADASDQLDIMTDKTEELTAAQKEYINLQLGQKLSDVAEQIAIMKNRLATLANIEARRGKLSKGQQEDLIELRAEYDLLIQTQKKYQDQVDLVSGKQKTNEEQIKKERDVIKDISNEYRLLALEVAGSTEEAAKLSDQLTAQALLGEGATKQALQEVVTGLQAIRSEREKLQAQQDREKASGRESTFAASVAGRGMSPAEKRAEDMQRIEQARQQDLISEQEYVAAINQLHAEANANRIKEAEDAYRAQGAAQAALLDGMHAIGQASANAIGGMIRKTTTAEEAIRSLAGTVVDQLINAVIQLGIEQVKSIIVGQTAGAAATAASVAAATTSAAAWAAPAALASLATLGANAAPAAAALTSTAALSQGIALAGGRRYGGPVGSGKMYQVNEGGAPELLTQGGKQYLMPTGDGKVTSADDLGGTVVNNINITTPPGMSAETQATNNSSGGQNIDVVIRAVASDIQQRGRVHSAITSTTTAGNRL